MKKKKKKTTPRYDVFSSLRNNLVVGKSLFVFGVIEWGPGGRQIRVEISAEHRLLIAIPRRVDFPHQRVSCDGPMCRPIVGAHRAKLDTVPDENGLAIKGVRQRGCPKGARCQTCQPLRRP